MLGTGSDESDSEEENESQQQEESGEEKESSASNDWAFPELTYLLYFLFEFRIPFQID